MNTVKEIEEAMASVAIDQVASLNLIQAEYDRLLEIMGNVDGNEITLLMLVAINNVSSDLKKKLV